MGPRPRVVFLCVGNACRSPIAEGWLRHLAGERFEAGSGGIHPIGVQPETVAVMAERGIDVSDIVSRPIRALLDPAPRYLVALALDALAVAPKIPRGTEILRWPVPDPFVVRGARRLDAFRATRDELEERVREWLATTAPTEDAAGRAP